MATLLEMVSEIVSAHASATSLSTDELLQEIEKVHAVLKNLEGGQQPEVTEEAKPTLSVKQAFKKNEVVCMVCGKGGFKTLARHLSKEHGMKPGEYRKQFGIPRTQPLTASSFTESRRKLAEQRGLTDILAKAREVRAAKNQEKAKSTKTAAPAKRQKKQK